MAVKEMPARVLPCPGRAQVDCALLEAGAAANSALARCTIVLRGCGSLRTWPHGFLHAQTRCKMNLTLGDADRPRRPQMAQRGSDSNEMSLSFKLPLIDQAVRHSLRGPHKPPGPVENLVDGPLLVQQHLHGPKRSNRKHDHL